MGQTLILECASGISGDMTVAALLDAGADRAALDRALGSLPVAGFTVEVGRTVKGGLDACDFAVRLDAEHENRDHDMDYLFGHERAEEAAGSDGGAAPCGAHDGGCGHMEGRCRSHGHAGRDRGHGDGRTHEHRTLADVLAVLEAAELAPRARAIATRVFTILAEAEAQAHGTTPEKVHFHEVGAVDSIVDVVAAAVCLDSLSVDDVVVTELAEGTGTVRCAHGIIPVPVPAVCAIAARHRLPLRATGVRGELVTPTGAAIAAAVRTSDRPPARYIVERVGLGAGKRRYEGCSGVLRALIVDPIEDGPSPADMPASASRPAAEPAGPGTDRVWKLECDIDDCTGEALGHVIDRLVATGAREAHCLPLVTKKGRPAWQLQVICTESERASLERLMFEETTTIGVRRVAMERTVLPRRAVTVATALGDMPAKEVVLPGGARRRYPEHDGVAAAAARAGVPYQDAYRACLAACAATDGKGRQRGGLKDA